jgi:hypothetical protein
MAFLGAQLAFGDTTPLIGTRTTIKAFTSKTRFPYFVRDIASVDLLAVPFVQFLRKCGYNKVNLFYSNETWGIGLANAVKPTLEFNDIEIFTTPEDQILPPAFINNAANFTYVGESLRNSGIRPVLVLLLPSYQLSFLDYLMNQSFTPDDVYGIHVSDAYLTGTPEQIAMRKPLVEGSVYLSPSTFIGTLGEKTRKQMEDDGYSPTGFNCQFYDSALHTVNALKSMIMRGKDYEDHDVAIKALRDTSFYGCTGKVAIDSDSNDRKDQDTDIINIQSTDEGITQVLVTVISLTSSQLINDKNPMQWPAGFTSAPKLDRLNYEDCPFPEEYRQEFVLGEDIIKYIGYSLITLTLLITAVILTKWRHLNMIKKVNAEAEETLADQVISLGIVIETLQYIGHGPQLKEGTDLLSLLGDYASGGTIKAIEFTRGVYWTLVITVLSCIGIWMISCLVLWLKHKEVKHRVLENLTWLAEVSVPLLGNILFLPFISVLFDVFYCVEGHGVDESSLDYSDSFMFKDCYEDCWTGKHLGFAIAAGIALVIYHPVTVVTRPLWQLYETDLHILTRPTFFLQKSLVDVIIVVIRRTLRKNYQTAHAVIYIVVLTSHLGCCIVRRPHNYARTNLWQSLSLCICIWTSTFCLMQMNIDFLANIAGDGILLGGVGFFLSKLHLVLGLLVQLCLTGYIKAPKHPYLNILFKFAFTLENVPPPDVLKRTLNYAVVQSADEILSSRDLHIQ